MGEVDPLSFVAAIITMIKMSKYNGVPFFFVWGPSLLRMEGVENFETETRENLIKLVDTFSESCI